MTEDSPIEAAAPYVTLSDMLCTGATYRQLDYWIRCGYIPEHYDPPAESRGQRGRSGYARWWTPADFDRLDVMVRLVRTGITPPKAAELARRYVLDGQRVVIDNSIVIVLPDLHLGGDS